MDFVLDFVLELFLEKCAGTPKYITTRLTHCYFS